MSKHNEIVTESDLCVVSSAVLMFTRLLLPLSGRSLPEPCPPCPLSICFHGEWLCGPLRCMSTVPQYQSLMTFTKKFYSNRFQEEKEERWISEFKCWVVPPKPPTSVVSVWVMMEDSAHVVAFFGGRHILCLQSWRAQIRSGGRVWWQ